MAAYVSNKVLLGHLGVPRHKRLQMFTCLVTSAIRWLLCVVNPSDSNFRKLRVGHVTLIMLASSGCGVTLKDGTGYMHVWSGTGQVMCCAVLMQG